MHLERDELAFMDVARPRVIACDSSLSKPGGLCTNIWCRQWIPGGVDECLHCRSPRGGRIQQCGAAEDSKPARGALAITDARSASGPDRRNAPIMVAL